MAGQIQSRRPGNLAAQWRSDPLAALRNEMNDLRTRFWGDDEGWFAGSMMPSLDLSETDTAIEVRVDLPGLKPKDIDIQLNGNILTVTGQREEEREEKGRTFHRVERQSGSFSRSITLPCSVAESEVAAEDRRFEGPQDQSEELRRIVDGDTGSARVRCALATMPPASVAANHLPLTPGS